MGNSYVDHSGDPINPSGCEPGKNNSYPLPAGRSYGGADA